MKHRGWIMCSGGLWLMIGVFLLYKGLRFISEGQVDGQPNQRGTMLVFFALIVGFLKGRFVFSKTVERVVLRIRGLSLPIRFSQVYPNSYWILIGSMMMLGMVFRFLPIPVDIRGFIDVAIGSALVNGAMLYFRAARLEAV